MSTAFSERSGRDERLRSVVIWGHVSYPWLWVPIARELKYRFGAAIHFICASAQSVAFWKRQDPDGVIDSFTTTNHFFTEYDRCDGSFEDICALARRYETQYRTYLVDVLQTDRHLGRGFFPGGSGHQRSHLSDKATYLKSTNAFNRAIQFWERVFDNVRPDLVIGVSSGIIGKTCAVIARARGIPIRVLMQTWYQSYVNWGVNEYYAQPTIAAHYETISDVGDTEVTDDELASLRRLPFTDAYYRDSDEQKTIRGFLRTLLRVCMSAARRRYRGVISYGNYKFSEKLRHAYQTFYDLRRLDRLPTVDVQTLRGKSYVVFPLHVEPESSLGQMSPEMNEQLAIVELLAKNLPAGTLIVVKEHLAAVGSRPKDFYSTLLKIPNLVMLHPATYLLDVARTARAVATITGTLGAEAAVLGIPVISFGLHNEFNCVPHVHVVESWTALRPLLNRLCGEDDPEARAQRQRDGKRFLAALKRSAVDFHWSNYTAVDRPPATEREVRVLYESLMASLNSDSTPVTSAVTTPVARIPA